jgi:hypothetical protein
MTEIEDKRKRKLILFWLSRVNSEYIEHVKKLMEIIRIGDFQLCNYELMRDEVKEEVIEGLFMNMKDLGWIKEIQEIKQSLGETPR